ncbi:hypothetical protein VTN96DRAFT_7111 [Rasamsonia emersonii]|uniref:Extracellular conserved serine-rich protein n=1 Tax=Rasamsonia emersonii (strain ATCC 16479 / CBS 393.64 / IMI 116815) TaxID=1408163 RepID=A0A0F4Z6S8_RASE3|nr:Extracellular conserved serine-rich protein [Rasamsonia emersonii CBS 393.64]KKA25796.1 Extracellular conserved serine-rich protein [Rasamsonia emersonii CBS 393.64]
MQVKVAAALAFAVSASALQVQYPAQGSELDLTKQNTIKWASVSTDPSSFDIYLVNNAVYPPVNQLIAKNVETSKGSYTLDGLKNVPADKGYQINLQSDSPQNTGILAQSGQFSVVSAGSSTTSASFTATTATDVTSTSTSTGSSTTLTTTTSASSSSSASASSSGASSSSASSTASSSAHASGANASSTSTPNAAGTLSVSTGASSLLLGLFALFM